jgi:hypothetical protein
MSRWKWIAAVAVGLAMSWLPARASLSQDDRPPPERRDRRDADKGAPRDDWSAPGDDRRAPPPDARRDGPGPRDGDDGMAPPRPLRDGDSNKRPPRDSRGPNAPPPLGPRPDGPPLQRPPRGPYEDWNALERHDPEMFKLQKQDMELDRQTRDQAEQYRHASKDERVKIKQQVQELVNKHFDVRQQRRALELKRLEDEIKQLREEVERREKGRKDLVEKRLSELLGHDDEMRF